MIGHYAKRERKVVSDYDNHFNAQISYTENKNECKKLLRTQVYLYNNVYR